MNLCDIYGIEIETRKLGTASCEFMGSIGSINGEPTGMELISYPDNSFDINFTGLNAHGWTCDSFGGLKTKAHLPGGFNQFYCQLANLLLCGRNNSDSIRLFENTSGFTGNEKKKKIRERKQGQ